MAKKKTIFENQTKEAESQYENLAENVTHASQIMDEKIQKTFYFLRNRTIQLCRNTVSNANRGERRRQTDRQTD